MKHGALKWDVHLFVTFYMILEHYFFVLLLQGGTEPFKPFTNRFHTPFNSSNSTAPFWYSIKRGPAYIIVLASYSSYGMGLLDFKLLKLYRLCYTIFPIPLINDIICKKGLYPLILIQFNSATHTAELAANFITWS